MLKAVILMAILSFFTGLSHAHANDTVKCDDQTKASIAQGNPSTKIKIITIFITLKELLDQFIGRANSLKSAPEPTQSLERYLTLIKKTERNAQIELLVDLATSISNELTSLYECMNLIGAQRKAK